MNRRALEKWLQKVRSRSNDYGIPKGARDLIHASVADAISTLPHRTELVELNKALEICLYQGQKTKAVLIARRIKQLQKGAR